jgi:hypothetical protein
MLPCYFLTAARRRRTEEEGGIVWISQGLKGYIHEDSCILAHLAPSFRRMHWETLRWFDASVTWIATFWVGGLGEGEIGVGAPGLEEGVDSKLSEMVSAWYYEDEVCLVGYNQTPAWMLLC